MSDHLVFVLPEYLEEALFALPVMMHYLTTRGVMSRHPASVTVVCKDPELDKLVEAHWKGTQIVREAPQDILDRADLVYEFDTEKAYALTKNIEKHVAEAYGIQLGVGLTRILPPVLTEDTPEVNGFLLVAERSEKDRPLSGSVWAHQKEFIEVGIQQGIPFGVLAANNGYEETRTAVGKASAIVGPRSSATLIGAAAGKIVLEMCPEEPHPQWMTKWESPKYRMVHGNLGDMIAEFVWDRLVKLVGELKQRKAA